jgi:hypothetical protein
MEKFCCTFVCNKAYFEKFMYTCNLLITKGNYKGEICLVIGDDLNNDETRSHDFIVKNNIIIKYFPDLKFPEEFLTTAKSLKRDPHWFPKLFQYHKFYLFDTYFKKWDYIFYLDCGITIFSDISPMVKLATKNRLLAHSDAHPAYIWKLSIQFDQTNELFKELNENFDLEISYPQTTIMLYSTEIIKKETFKEIYELTLKYPISKTNDQGMISLYFTNVKNLWRQIQTRDGNNFYYDYLIGENKGKSFIMVKSV